MARQQLGASPVTEFTTSSGVLIYDNKVNSSIVTGSAVNSLNTSWTHTGASTPGPGYAGVVALMVGQTSGTSYTTFTRSVTWGGVAMTSQGAVNIGSKGWVELFGLVGAASGSQTVAFTVSKGSSGNMYRASAISLSYTNVVSFDTCATSTGSGTALAISGNSQGYLQGGINVFAQGSGSSMSMVYPAFTQGPLGYLSRSQVTSNSSSTELCNMAVGDANNGYMVSNFQATSSSGSAAWGGLLLNVNLVLPTTPVGIRGAWVTVLGCGAAGGSGRNGSSGTAAYGGEGGQGGNEIFDYYVPGPAWGPTYQVLVSNAGGIASSGVTTASTNGSNGGYGHASVVVFKPSAVPASIYIAGGTGGFGGTNALGTGSSTSTRGIWTSAPGGLGGAGSAGSSGGGGDAILGWGGPGGGGGGGVASNTASAGGIGGGNWNQSIAEPAGGAAGGGTGNDGGPVRPGYVTTAGGGGGGASSGAGGPGGQGVGYGCGGGGGGANQTAGQPSGPGGNGGPGYVRIIWDYPGQRQQLGLSPLVEYDNRTTYDMRINMIPTPPNIQGAWLYGVAPGGAGGAGGCASVGGTAYGGAGGYGANITRRWIPASLLPATYNIAIGAILTGPAGRSTAGNGAATSSDESQSSTDLWTTGYIYGSVFELMTSPGSNGGGGPQTTITPWGFSFNTRGTQQGRQGAISGYVYAGNGSVPIGGAPYSPTFDTDVDQATDMGAGCGGGAGGAVISGSARAGSEGGYPRYWGLSGGAGGVIGGAAPTAPALIGGGVNGGGGGGGASAASGPAQAGANALGYGAGGGGGGASIAGSLSGAGGNGGPGYMSILWDGNHPVQPLGALAFDQAGVGANATSTSLISWSQTVTSIQGMAVVFFSGGVNGTAVGTYGLSCLYAGSPMQFLGHYAVGTPTGTVGFIRAYCLYNPPVGTSTITVISNTPSSVTTLVGSSVVYSNAVRGVRCIDSKEIFTSQGSQNFDNLRSYTTTSNTPSLSVPDSASGRILVCGMASTQAQANHTQTVRSLRNYTNSGIAGNLSIQEAAGSSSPVVFSADSNSGPWVTLAVEIM